ncbi:hypothetical protein FACS1894217_06610 [Clostridia bacterium]|nr:hypothetical protein FACS1894217_06610 [Clostridia bacterium]
MRRAVSWDAERCRAGGAGVDSREELGGSVGGGVGMRDFIDFLETLEQRKIYYKLNKIRDGVMECQ